MTDDIERDLDAALAQRLADLDQRHARACTPLARRELERMMTEVRAEREKLRQQAKVIDIEYGRWLRAVKAWNYESKR